MGATASSAQIIAAQILSDKVCHNTYDRKQKLFNNFIIERSVQFPLYYLLVDAREIRGILNL